MLAVLTDLVHHTARGTEYPTPAVSRARSRAISRKGAGARPPREGPGSGACRVGEYDVVLPRGPHGALPPRGYGGAQELLGG